MQQENKIEIEVEAKGLDDIKETIDDVNDGIENMQELLELPRVVLRNNNDFTINVWINH